MSFKLIGGGSGLETVISDVNQTVLELKNQEVTKVIKDETGTRVVIMDKEGLRTTEPGAGIDVFTAGDDEFTFDSRRNVFKIVGTGTGTFATGSVDAPGGGGWASDYEDVTISHDLGFVPAILAYIEISSGDYLLMPYTTFTVVGSTNMQFYHYSVYANDSDVTFRAQIMVDAPFGTSHGFGGENFKYYLLQETAN